MAHVQKKRKLSPSSSEAKHHRESDRHINDAAPPSKTFQELGIRPELCDACQSMGFTEARPIQIEAIPYALQGRDVIGLAETGSGKTAAFALPILQGMRCYAHDSQLER